MTRHPALYGTFAAVLVLVAVMGGAAWARLYSTPVTPTGTPSTGTTAPHNNPGLGVAGEGGGE